MSPYIVERGDNIWRRGSIPALRVSKIISTLLEFKTVQSFYLKKLSFNDVGMTLTH